MHLYNIKKELIAIYEEIQTTKGKLNRRRVIEHVKK